jgi:hemoglobin/transferrin/lactoferrin receptor protein
MHHDRSHRHYSSPLRPLAAALVASFATTLPVQAAAAETALKQVSVSAPAYSDTTALIKTSRIDETAPRDTRDMLQHVTGISIGGGGSAMNQKLYVREIEDTLLTLTLDGVPQGGNIFHHQGRILIDPQLLKTVELDKGGTVASVGPGGLAGSVRMSTKDAADLLRPGQHIGALLSGGAASNESWHGGGAVYGKLSDTQDFLLYGKRSDSADYEDGNGRRQMNTAARQDSTLAKWNWRAAPGHALSVALQSLNDQATRYPRPHMVGFTGSNAPTPQELEQKTLTAGYRYDGGHGLPGVDLKLFSEAVENTRVNRGTGPVFGKPVSYIYGESLETDGVNLLLSSRFGAQMLRYGFNHQRRVAAAINPLKRNAAGGSSEERSEVKGLFAESMLPLGSSWLLALGARYDWYDYDDNHGQHFSSDGLSPNANLTWQLNDALSLRMAASRTVRGAGLKETFMLDNGPGPLIYRNATTLKEETARNAEVGMNYEHGPWSLKGALFSMTIDDYLSLLYRGGPSPTATRENVGQVKSRGYELGGAWRNGPLQASLSVSDAKPRLNGADLGDGDFSLGTALGRNWRLGLDYQLAAPRIDLGWQARIAESISYQPGVDNDPVKKDGYVVHDLHASWQPLGADRLRLTLSIRNLFDKAYYDQATYGYDSSRGIMLGYAEPGRDVRLDMSWKF